MSSCTVSRSATSTSSPLCRESKFTVARYLFSCDPSNNTPNHHVCGPTIFHHFPFRVAPSPHSTINIHSLIPFYLPSTGTADRRRNASGSTTQCLARRKLAVGRRLGLRPFRAAVGGSSSSAPVGCSVKHRGCPFEFLVHKKFDVQLCWTD